MNLSELEPTLLKNQKDISDLQSQVSGLQSWIDTLKTMILKESTHNTAMWAKDAEHRRDLQDRAFLYTWEQRFQFQILREMLFESADKLGRTQEQMEAEFDRRWRKRLDENLQRLEDTDPNLAGRVDGRTEDQIPE